MLEISCESFVRQMINIKRQALFSLKKKQNKNNNNTTFFRMLSGIKKKNSWLQGLGICLRPKQKKKVIRFSDTFFKKQMCVGSFLFLLLFSGWVHSWTFGFVWLNKMATGSI